MAAKKRQPSRIKTDFNKYLELERLVNTGGDEARIKELRIELNINSRPSEEPDIDVAKYEQLKKEGYLDREIESMIGTTKGLFRKWKKQNGLINKEGV